MDDFSSPPILSSNRVLAALSVEHAPILHAHLHPLELKQGDRLLRAGESIERVIFPQSGVVSIVVTMDDGMAVEAAMVGREGVIGASLASGMNVALNDAIVQVPGTARAIPFARFAEALDESEALRDSVARCNAVLLAQAQQSAACNALHSAEARVCRWLLELQDRCDGDVIPLTQEYLSEMLGLQRTTVTLIASRLQSIEAIRCRRGKIRILDRHALEHGACECYGRIQHYAAQLQPDTARSGLRPMAADASAQFVAAR